MIVDRTEPTDVARDDVALHGKNTLHSKCGSGGYSTKKNKDEMSSG